MQTIRIGAVSSVAIGLLKDSLPKDSMQGKAIEIPTAFRNWRRPPPNADGLWLVLKSLTIWEYSSLRTVESADGETR